MPGLSRLGVRDQPHAEFALALAGRGALCVLGAAWAWADGVVVEPWLGHTLDACERAGLVKVDGADVLLTEAGAWVVEVGSPRWQRGQVFPL